MFKFGFSSDSDDKDSNDGWSKCDKKWDDCKQLVPVQNKLVDNILTSAQFKVITLGDIDIKYMCSNEVIDVLRKEDCSKNISVLKAEQSHSDLLPAIYEGGFKIWECTYDLLQYLDDSGLSFQNKKVLDLGCGAGIVGIYTLLNGASCCFQDYNSDVIEYITIPNVYLNSKDCISSSKFYSGDWQHFSNFLSFNTCEDNKFDFILTSETIYNTENYNKLHEVLEKLLKRKGTIFLAAKSFYFGVGGGISLFEDLIDKQGIFEYSSGWNCTEGVKREILKIQFKNIESEPSNP